MAHESYFRLPFSLIDQEVWARLSPTAKALLPVVARHCPIGGARMCTASDEVLMRDARIEQRTLQKARKQLEAEGLVREVRRGAWEVLPGVEWSRGEGTGRRPYGRESAPTGAKAPLRALGSAPTGAKAPVQALPSLLRSKEKSSSKEERRAAAVMTLLRKELGQEDPEEVLVSYAGMLPREGRSPLTVLRCYIRQADAKAAKGTLRNRAGYIRDAVRESYRLWEGVQQRVIDEAIEAASRRLAALLEANLSPQDMQLFRRALKQGSEWADSLRPRELAVRAMYRARLEDPDVEGDDELLELALAGVGIERGRA